MALQVAKSQIIFIYILMKRKVNNRTKQKIRCLRIFCESIFSTLIPARARLISRHSDWVELHNFKVHQNLVQRANLLSSVPLTNCFRRAIFSFFRTEEEGMEQGEVKVDTLLYRFFDQWIFVCLCDGIKIIFHYLKIRKIDSSSFYIHVIFTAFKYRRQVMS